MSRSARTPRHIGLVADTHLPRFGKALPIPLVHAFRQAKVDLILHAGDFTEPIVATWFEAIAPFTAVAGNNDGADLRHRFGRQRIVDVGGARIGLIHGDGARGSTPERAWHAFADAGVQAIVFGHSHQPLCEQRNGIWLINPGSPSDKRRQPLYSFGILTVQAGQVIPTILAYPDRTKIPERYVHLLGPDPTFGLGYGSQSRTAAG